MSDRIITVIGDGQMGLVMAEALHRSGAQTRVWGPFREDLESLSQTRQTARLEGFSLSPEIEVVMDGPEAVKGASLSPTISIAKERALLVVVAVA